ncbi:DUF424 family protein [Candidatus Woesearchaeota archaeon]|jgi:hypothetical protein|nr:DUF424 family protein [Candidatus Woesearchaeota archaeon]MBT4367761.1 DUF424 family protein [Candidatus Woesearchaeota archaeon]MBT4712249.1 DUF424 family protein [Candidatus Woesearchaeota archaeon]MBT6638797.1 DUF424 family protein [Candidatus Woesearchaeota archaeon]MBT7134441.1 DUF424 family protein [Candidatus Woesearchaeota archaeon]
MNFILSKHSRDGKLFLNIVDLELKDKILENDTIKIDLTEKFYQGEEVDGQEISTLFEQAYSIQFIGNNSIELGKQHDLVETVSEVEKVKYAFVIRM